jgi:hypothetical protein
MPDERYSCSDQAIKRHGRNDRRAALEKSDKTQPRFRLGVRLSGFEGFAGDE